MTDSMVDDVCDEPTLHDVCDETTCLHLGLPLGIGGEKQVACRGCRNYHDGGSKGERTHRSTCERQFMWRNEKPRRKKRVYEGIVEHLASKGVVLNFLFKDQQARRPRTTRSGTAIDGTAQQPTPPAEEEERDDAPIALSTRLAQQAEETRQPPPADTETPLTAHVAPDEGEGTSTTDADARSAAHGSLRAPPACITPPNDDDDNNDSNATRASPLTGSSSPVEFSSAPVSASSVQRPTPLKAPPAPPPPPPPPLPLQQQSTRPYQYHSTEQTVGKKTVDVPNNCVLLTKTELAKLKKQAAVGKSFMDMFSKESQDWSPIPRHLIGLAMTHMPGTSAYAIETAARSHETGGGLR